MDTTQLSRSQLLMLLLASEGFRGQHGEPIQGTTRLQKLLFLLEQEAKLHPSLGKGFNFTPWKFGPVSKELYDDLEKLENLGLLQSAPVAMSSSTECDEFDLSFDDLMGEEESQSRDNLEEKQYSLTTVGLQWVQKHVDPVSNKAALDTVRRIKTKYGALSLQDLLHYVYTKYPEMTSASEIKDKVLRRK
jgi:uncharacterized protein YwgA